ncbi:MAG TPA: VOC family protein [Xanthomonadaceae bacterium]|jgi:catechol-2,3-dioxygenase
MTSTPTAAVLTIVYAKDIARVAAFYRGTLSLPVLEEEAGFIVLGRDGLEIAIVRMSADAAARNEIASPPRRREQTPIKPSFLVDDFERVRAEAIAAGGDAKPLAAAWSWRGQLHLDGHDPEGNVVQFRRREG